VNDTPSAPPRTHLPKALTPDELDALRMVPMNLRDRALIAVMAGCGLRVSEACGLGVDNVYWSNDTPALRFAGKRGKERVVPMNLEVQDALRDWLDMRGIEGSPYVFCNLRTGGRLSRKTVWASLKRYAARATIRHVHPHMLRHTFGTSLADKNVPVERIRELMGHAKMEMSQIYISVSAEQKKDAVERIDRRSRLIRWLSRQRNRGYRFFGRPRKGLVFSAPQTVGRREELRRLRVNLEKGIDTLLLGPVGVGKSHLLALLDGDRLIRVKGLSPVRQAVIGIAEALYEAGALRPCAAEDIPGEDQTPRAHPKAGDLGRPLQPDDGETPEEDQTAMGRPLDAGEGPGDAPGDATGFDAVKKAHTRTAVQGWTQMVLDCVEENAWTLVIDDLSDLSASTGRLLDRLNRKFVVFAALHEVRPAHERYFWKFDRIGLDALPPADARRLIGQCAAGADVEDLRLFETAVWRQSAGNPRAVIEIVDRLRKEPAITRTAVRDVAHTGAVRKIDLTPALMVVAMVLVAARFIARGAGSIDGYLIAGVGSAVMMGLRFFMFRLRR